jgi:hypothetical protein
MSLFGESPGGDPLSVVEQENNEVSWHKVLSRIVADNRLSSRGQSVLMNMKEDNSGVTYVTPDGHVHKFTPFEEFMRRNGIFVLERIHSRGVLIYYFVKLESGSRAFVKITSKTNTRTLQTRIDAFEDQQIEISSVLVKAGVFNAVKAGLCGIGHICPKGLSLTHRTKEKGIEEKKYNFGGRVINAIDSESGASYPVVTDLAIKSNPVWIVNIIAQANKDFAKKDKIAILTEAKFFSDQLTNTNTIVENIKNVAGYIDSYIDKIDDISGDLKQMGSDTSNITVEQKIKRSELVSQLESLTGAVSKAISVLSSALEISHEQENINRRLTDVLTDSVINELYTLT